MASDNDDSGMAPPTRGAKPSQIQSLELADVYRDHFSFVWRFLRSRGATPSEADDLTQETFVIVERKIATFAARSSIRTWIAGIAFNVARQARRRQAREVPSAPEDSVFETQGLGANPSDAAQLSQEAQFVQSVLNKMTPAQREILTLIDIEGFTSVEAAQVLGINEYTARSRLRTARLVLNAAVAARKSREC